MVFDGFVKQSLQGLLWFSEMDLDHKWRPKKTRLPYTEKSKLAIFDLDETLVHWISDYDFDQNIATRQLEPADTILTSKQKFKEEKLPINVRPYYKEWLKRLKK